MRYCFRRFGWSLPGVMILAVLLPRYAPADPPPINPFGKSPDVRDDTISGYVELSDGTICAGQVYLTRDKRLEIYDNKMQRQREVPLRVVKQIECRVAKEWMEKEWKFKELASDEKMFTGRTYPAREYVHRITLNDDRTITGALSGIVYVQPPAYDSPEPGVYRQRVEPQRFLLHKRDKGEIGDELKSMTYVRFVKLGPDALSEGRRKAAEQQKHSATPGKE